MTRPATVADANAIPSLPEPDFSLDSGATPCYYSDSMRRYGFACIAIGRGNAVRDYMNFGAAGAPAETAKAVDVCAKMRALCSACGGTGDVHSITGEWRGACDCEASAWSRAPQIDATTAPIGEAVTMPGTSGFTMACFKAVDVPVGTKLYTAPATTPDVAKDAARLDFLMENYLLVNGGTAFGYYVEKYSEDMHEHAQFGPSMPTRRAAIDAAMGALPPTGSEKGGA